MKDNVIGLSDYTNLNGFEKPILNPQVIENQIVDNFQKGKITEEIFLGGINTLDKIEKGKRGVVGEIRTWSGKKYQKTATGWQPVKEGGAIPAGKTDPKDKELGDYLESKMGKAYRDLVDQIKEEGFDEETVNSTLDNFHTTGRYKKSDLVNYFKNLKSEKSKKDNSVESDKKFGDPHKGEDSKGSHEKRGFSEEKGDEDVTGKSEKLHSEADKLKAKYDKVQEAYEKGKASKMEVAEAEDKE